MTDAPIPEFDQENIYQTFVQTAELGICTLDLNHKINFANNKMMELLGYQREELIGLDFSALLPATEQEELMSLIKNGKQGLKAKQEVQYITKNGSSIWTNTTASPMYDQQGEYKGALAMVTDITAHKAEIDVIKNSEAQFRSFFENSMDGFLLTIPNERIFAANPAACALFQMSEEEICKLTPEYIFTFAEPKLLEILKTRNRLGRAKAEVLFVQKDGKEIPGEVTTVLFKDARGMEQSSIIIRDISDRSHREIAEQTLERSEANLRTIFNNTDVGYVLVNADLNVLSYNGLAIDISMLQGYKYPQEGESILDYFDPERHELIQNVADRVLLGEKIEYEVRRVEPDGSDKWYNLCWIPITGEDKQNMGLLLSIADITKVKIAAIQSEKITAELLQRNKDLEEFTYVVSHNLRAPVANIIGLAALLEDAIRDSEGAGELVKSLAVSIKKLDDVISDLNHVLQLREQLNEGKENVDLQQLINDLQLSINHLIVKHRVSLSSDFTKVPMLNTVKSYIHSIFYNLVSNSIRYRRSGVPPVITIKSEELPGAVKLTFEDNGKGIDMEKDGDSLFGLYKRIDTSVDGKGLGLYLVKTQIKALHGSIAVESEVNTGTRFILTLPL